MHNKIKNIHYCSVNSTNDVALDLLKKEILNTDKFSQYIVVTADFQTQGRGRNGHEWFGDENNNLYFSFALKHSSLKIKLYLLQVIGSLAVYELLANIIDLQRLKIKYPNDIYVFDDTKYGFKKIAGIISETNFLDEIHCNSVIGIGLNVSQQTFPNEIANNATSLKLLGITKNIKTLSNNLAAIIAKILTYDENHIIDEWKKIINIDNKKVMLLSNPDKIYFARKILTDCRLLLVDELNNEVIIDNGNSIRYEL